MFDLFLLILSFCRPARILRWSAFLLTVTIAWLALENSTLQAYIQERERRNGYREQVDQLKQQQKQLETDISDLKAGGFRLEKAIRERFHLIKPGEKIIYIESPGDKDKAPAPDSREQLSTALLESAAASPTPEPTPAEAAEADGKKAQASRKPAAEDEQATPAAKKKSAAPAEPVARATVAKKRTGAKSSTKGTESGAKSSKSSTKAKRTKKRSAASTTSDNQ